MKKKIGVLTSGGDAPGMNAAIRAIVRSSINKGIEVYGIMRGYQGLIEGDFKKLDVADVGDIIHRGGTILKTARSNDFKTEAGLNKAVEQAKNAEFSAIIAIGGDGTLLGCRDLVKNGITVFHLPATIDNDLGYTDYTIGFDTAVNTVLNAINSIRETGMAHDKTTIIEVMGRECGDIALRAGLAGGADWILIPEIDTEVCNVCNKVLKGMKRNKKNNIIVRAEGAKITTEELSDCIKQATGEEVRKVILGYLQRGGSPSALDRTISTIMGVRAIELVYDDENSKALAFSENRVIELDIEDAVKIERQPDLELLEIVDDLA